MTSKTMKAAVFVERDRIELREKPIPEIGPDDALVRVTTTTICGTDTIDGTQAEFFVVPHAKANLAIVPNQLTDEEVLMVPDIMSTGFAAAESGNVGIGDIVAIFAQGPIGLCATAGARLSGAAKVIAVDRVPNRLATATLLGADHIIDFAKVDPVEEIMMII